MAQLHMWGKKQEVCHLAVPGQQGQWVSETGQWLLGTWRAAVAEEVWRWALKSAPGIPASVGVHSYCNMNALIIFIATRFAERSK
jgi:hypothetical protein